MSTERVHGHVRGAGKTKWGWIITSGQGEERGGGGAAASGGVREPAEACGAGRAPPLAVPAADHEMAP